MKIKILLLFCLLLVFRTTDAQKPEDVYKKPLKEVLGEIEKRYKVKLQYNENNIKDLFVLYPTWRYRVDIEPTLNNILMPLDMIFLKTGENNYQVSKYVYYERTVEEGKKHLDQLLESYSCVLVRSASSSVWPGK